MNFITTWSRSCPSNRVFKSSPLTQWHLMPLDVRVIIDQFQSLLLVNMCYIFSMFTYQHLIKTQKRREFTYHITHGKNTTSITSLNKQLYVQLFWKCCFIPTCDLCQDCLDKSSMETLLPCFKLFMKAFGISQKTIGLTYTITSKLKNNHMLPSTLISSTMIYCSIFKLHKFHPNNNNNFFLI
jgi:hypothetical protein